ncbi:hypothetical protein KQX54_014296 [Cotesia glomerata]|uniref:Uncharacterized protein n=1 Tax=Cotesia glomerata TaxID=32391 RepID=A0AAV7IUR8_COTGL|nr:hypothetical protein KQX54_014296 [Cotesia glomerata]
MIGASYAYITSCGNLALVNSKKDLNLALEYSTTIPDFQQVMGPDFMAPVLPQIYVLDNGLTTGTMLLSTVYIEEITRRRITKNEWLSTGWQSYRISTWKQSIDHRKNMYYAVFPMLLFT